MSPPPVSTHALLEHADWVRALARSLVFDASRADDIVQATWLEALERPPRAATNLRGWLASVVRNTVRQSGRSERRRVEREHASARPEALPATADLVEQATRQRELVDLVVALEEPYRTVVLLRWFEGLKPTEIAERQNCPVRTVKTRLARALVRLRERLDRSHGSRDAWGVALLPLAHRSAPVVSSALLGGLIVMANLKWFSAALTLAVGTWFFLGQNDGEHVLEVADTGHGVLEPSDPTLQAAEAPGEAQREELEVAAVTASDSEAEVNDADRRELRGRLIDARGKALADHAIVFQPFQKIALPALETELDWRVYLGLERGFIDVDEYAKQSGLGPGLREAVDAAEVVEYSASTDADGSFAVDFVSGEEQALELGLVSLVDPAWKVIGDGHLDEGDVFVVVASRVARAGGVVVTTDGAPVENVEVQALAALEALELPAALSVRIGARSWRATTSADGHFEFPGLPVVQGITLSVEDDRFARYRDPLPIASFDHFEIVLREKIEQDEPLLTGIVVDEGSDPIEGAKLRLGTERAKSDADGRFRIAIGWIFEPTSLVAVKSGYAPAVHGEFVPNELPGVDERADIVLVLGSSTRTIEGRVLRHDGLPYAGLSIGLADGTSFGGASTCAEMQALDRKAREVFTDDDGRFVMPGLLDRDYRLLFWNDSGAVLLSDPVAAGTHDFVLVEPSDALHDVVAGRLVTRHGVPVARARVNLYLNTRLSKYGSGTYLGPRLTTDADGRFRFEGVARRYVELIITGDSVMQTSFVLPESDPVDALEIEVPMECRLRVEVESQGNVASYEVHDAAGEPVTQVYHQGGTATHTTMVWISNGAFPLCKVGDSGVSIVFHDSEGETTSRPLQLVPDEVVTVTAP